MRKTSGKYNAKTNKDNIITSAYLRNGVIKKTIYNIGEVGNYCVVVGTECTSSLSRYVTFEFNYKSSHMKNERRRSIRLNQSI